MASSSIPPPPPPPPPIQLTPKTLSRSERPSKNSNDLGGVRSPRNTPDRSVPPKIHPQALQHAAANLRKTQHHQPLQSLEPEQLLGRPAELSSGGYRSPLPLHDPMGQHSPGAAVYASPINPNPSLSIGNRVIGSNSLSKPLGPPTPASGNSRWTTAYGQPLFYASPKPSSITNNNNNDNYSTYSSSSTTTYYPSPQPQPTTTTYSYSYSSDSVPPDYPPPPPPPLETVPKPSAQNYYSTYSSSTTTNQQQQPPSHNGHNGAYISNPQSYIHEFATKTPIVDIDPSLAHVNLQPQTTPVAKPKSYSFAEQLRDNTLTERQKYANQFQRTHLPERLPPQAVAHIYQETTADTEKQLSQRRQQQQQPLNGSSSQASKIDEVDELIKAMEWRMKTGNTNDICSKCQKEIINDTPGVTALGKPYHVTCFCCDQCQKQLAGCSFYSVDGKNLCQVDYMNSLDKCDKCATPITSKILRAMGKAFHPECFACPSCNKSLDGIPFTVDLQGTPYCLDCYHERFSPRCAVCLKAIVPQAGETEVARIVAMDRSYHLTCYKCEDCGLQLNSKIEGQGCYPLESHLFCKNCNLKRLKAMH